MRQLDDPEGRSIEFITKLSGIGKPDIKNEDITRKNPSKHYSDIKAVNVSGKLQYFLSI